ncbi:sigma-70 family RNA polymerase sigma factor [Botrimarina sp.]|uniref:sigma-70 family RNA polymerase sigma factor n=1 Tax=Botrimarina sp. TaxID=2795802 RepID=UPI0032EDEDD5
MDDRESDFVTHLTDAQPALFSYICMLLGGVQEANNVLQETNLVLWKKAGEFQPGSNFKAWAREVAYYKALSHMRDSKRSRVFIDQDRIEAAIASSSVLEDTDERRVALRHCLTELTDEQMNLLGMRYRAETPVVQIASLLGKSEGAVKMTLRRIRLGLMECIQRRIRAGHA